MPRFVIVEHDHPVLHWDLMLEAGETLRTWRLSARPIPGVPIAAEPLPPHRREYLDYEGPVSGDRGTVSRWDRGEYRVLTESPSRLEIELRGNKIEGRAAIAPSSGSAIAEFTYQACESPGDGSAAG